MRTLYTLFALISLVLVALVATAAPPTPTFNVNCSTVVSPGVCSGGVSFSGGGLNPHKDYEVVATFLEDPTQDFTDTVTVNPDRTYTAPGEVFVSPGHWTFTLVQVGNNGSVNDLLVEMVLFE